MVHLLKWVRSALQGAAALSAMIVVVYLVRFQAIPASAIESLFLFAAFGGALGSLEYRLSLAVPALTQHAFACWGLSVGWGAPLLLTASVVRSGAFSVMPGQVVGSIAVAAVVSAIALFPLCWLQGKWLPRHAP